MTCEMLKKLTYLYNNILETSRNIERAKEFIKFCDGNEATNNLSIENHHSTGVNYRIYISHDEVKEILTKRIESLEEEKAKLEKEFSEF